MSPVVPPISVMTTSYFALVRNFANARLDFVGDVRNHLHGFAEVIAAALFQDDAFINLAAG